MHVPLRAPPGATPAWDPPCPERLQNHLIAPGLSPHLVSRKSRHLKEKEGRVVVRRDSTIHKNMFSAPYVDRFRWEINGRSSARSNQLPYRQLQITPRQVRIVKLRRRIVRHRPG